MNSSLQINLNYSAIEAAVEAHNGLLEKTAARLIPQLSRLTISFSVTRPSIQELKLAASEVLESLSLASKENIKVATVANVDCKIVTDSSSSREAEIIVESLRVDREPKRSNTSKTLSVQDNACHIDLSAPDVREIRTATNSLLDRLHLVTETIRRFGPACPASKKLCSHQIP
ncbi:uncharacterized protein LOC108674102 [Hyalella azteca]|uniref:L antigen family member 3 n=1 Tax=Hyalella azteca TaxID=294128 RepID=A0A8B7NUT1_HYAAZ|nr:uncharacterized protein LOC108674102 [Hyalella azteca]XP_047740665.1 uncharacterized protein LOC108674102 [Hyalella azteca]